MNLPSRARNGLNGVARELLRQPTVEKPRRQWVEDVVAWCRQQDIDLGMRLSSQALRFDAELLAQIDSVLASAHLAPLGRSLSGLSSAAQAKEGVEEDKATRTRPGKFDRPLIFLIVKPVRPDHHLCTFFPKVHEKTFRINFL